MVRARRLLAAGALVPLLAVAGCSSDSPPSAPGDGTSPGSTAATGAPGATDSPAAPTPERTKIPVKVTLNDSVLGNLVSVDEVVRNMPFPAGHPISAESFEIIGVHVHLTAGTRYSAALQPAQITLKHGSGYVRPTTEFGPSFAKPVETAQRGQTRTGWLIYKVDQGAGPLEIMLHRPAYRVSTTGEDIPAQVFTVPLTE